MSKIIGIIRIEHKVQKEKIKVCCFIRTLGSESKMEQQAKRLTEFVAQFDVLDLVYEIRDYNSGSEIDRMKIEELIEGIEQGEYNLIFITHTDRIANDPKEATAFCDRVHALGGMIYSLEEGPCTIDSDDEWL